MFNLDHGKRSITFEKFDEFEGIGVKSVEFFKRELSELETKKKKLKSPC